VPTPARGREPLLHDADTPLAPRAARALRAGHQAPATAGRLDRRDCPVALDGPITGDLALRTCRSSRRAGTKPFYVRRPGHRDRRMGQPAPGRRYGELQAGVQLANRSGPLNEIEYSEFVQKVQAFAEAVGATARRARHAGSGGPRARAGRAVAAAGRPVVGDLRTNGVAWSVGYVQQVAGRLGFVPVWCRAGWCCPARKRARRPCWCWPWTRRPRWPKTRRPPWCANAR
jgi:hypothetical protein